MKKLFYTFLFVTAIGCSSISHQKLTSSVRVPAQDSLSLSPRLQTLAEAFKEAKDKSPNCKIEVGESSIVIGDETFPMLNILITEAMVGRERDRLFELSIIEEPQVKYKRLTEKEKGQIKSVKFKKIYRVSLLDEASYEPQEIIVKMNEKNQIIQLDTLYAPVAMLGSEDKPSRSVRLCEWK